MKRKSHLKGVFPNRVSATTFKMSLNYYDAYYVLTCMTSVYATEYIPPSSV